MRWTWLVPGLIVAGLLQGPGIAAAQPAPERKWEVEVHGGGIRSTTPTDGTGALPAPGPTIPSTFVGGGATRAVSSWYFGDGAALLNQAASSFRLGATIAPLDPVLQSALVERQSGGAFGVRVGRDLTRHFTAELSVDYLRGALALTGRSAADVEATRASFVTTWNALLRPVAQNTQNVNSVVTMSDRGGSRIVTAGTLLIHPMSAGRLRPYAAVGAGVMANRGTPQSVGLAGDYRFGLVAPPGIPVPPLAFHETDTVTVRASVENAAVWIVGGGIKFAVTDRWGLRADVRDHIARSTLSTVLDATPTTTPATSGVFGSLTLGTTPPLQFSTPPFTTRSNLSGTPIAAFTTFSGTGLEHHVNVTAGLFWRF